MKKTLIAAAAVAALLPANAVLAGSPAPAPVDPVIIEDTDIVAGGSLSGAGLAAVLIAAAAVIAVAASSDSDSSTDTDE